MFEFGTDLFTSVIIFLLLVLTYLFTSWIKRCSVLPPGPRPFPIIGNILQLFHKDLRQVCEEYRKTYGDIFTIHIFNQPVIVVNGFETLKDVFVKNGDVFSERITIDAMRVGIGGEGIGLANGEIWKRNRRFVVRTLRDFGMGKRKLQASIHEEIHHFLDDLDKQKERPFDIENLITTAISNIMCLLVFGKRFSYADQEFIDNIVRMRELFATNLVMKPGWFRFIPGDPFNVEKCVGHLKHLADFYRSKIREHYEDFDENDPRDFIDVYIKLSKADETTAEKKLHIKEDEIVRILHDLFAAGTETTATVLRFALVCMLRNPEEQEKVFTELTRIVPDNRLPDTDDLKKLPYLQTTISEILRRASVGPFALPHRTKADIQYRGYTIPKSAYVFPNLESVLHDETLWDAPFDFCPGRFLMERISHGKIEEFIPFGIGPRSCPGESMARMELSLFLPAMIQHFRFLPPEGEDPPSFSTTLGTTAAPLPFKLRAVRRT